MSITFHCEHCGKKIEAKETAAGKWGKCPSCHNKVYVPDPNAEGDLKLAPVDETEEERKKRLMEETFQLEQEILSERPDKTKGDNNSAPATPPPTTGRIDEDELYNTIVKHLRQMADGELDLADVTLRTIQSDPETALKLIDRIALSDIPEAELSDIKPQVLAGLIRTLRSKLT